MHSLPDTNHVRNPDQYETHEHIKRILKGIQSDCLNSYQTAFTFHRVWPILDKSTRIEITVIVSHEEFRICLLIICLLMSNQGLYFGQLVIGPAGSGKSTYCQLMQQMAETLKRNILIVNLDPAAEVYKYRCDIDIKDLITLDDVMEQMELGPNGALIYCMEYLMQNTEWLHEQLNDVGSDDYVIFDCPGQIELYSHLDVFKDLVRLLQNYGFSLCSVYLLDITFTGQHSKFLSGMLQALAAQISLQLPSITVLSKCDLIKDKQKIRRYIDYPDDMDEQLPQDHAYSSKIVRLNKAIKSILDSCANISLRELDVNDENTIRDILTEIDNAIQYGENIEPDDKLYDEAEESMQDESYNNREFH